MKNLYSITTVLFLFISLSSFAQEEIIIPADTIPTNDSGEVFVFLTDQPSFPGGTEAQLEYIRNNLKYPELAKEQGIQGIVYVTFVVEKDGSITNVKLLRGIGGGCDEEAVRVIKNMPNWKPGFQQGKPARCQFNMPIKYVLYSGSANKLSKKELKAKKKKEKKELKAKKKAEKEKEA